MNGLNLTLGLIVANILVFFTVQGNAKLLHKFIFVNGAVRKQHEYGRLIASGFTHASPMHLLFNMLTLYFFGPYVEELYGPLVFLGIFIGSVIGGNVLCMLLFHEDDRYSALGASGGLFGVVYAFIWAMPEARLSLMFIPVPIKGWLFGILISIISILLTQSKRGHEANISHEGHLGGALTGGIMAISLQPKWPNGHEWYFIIGGIVPILGLVAVKWMAPQILYRHRRHF
jgi:membrane associated rhomboid family serine protease